MGKRLKSFTLKMIGGANVATIIIMLLIGYSGNINPAEHPTIASVGLFFPIFLVINLLFLVFWILFYWRGALIPILGYIVAYVPVRTYIPFNYPSAPPEGAIKVLSFNVYNFAVADGGRGLDNGIVDYILNSGADIVCLQEAAMHVLDLEEVAPVLKKEYPHSLVYGADSNQDCLSIFTKYPILRAERIKYDSDSNLSLAYYLNIDGEEVLVVNNHFESNKLNQEDKDKFKSIVKGTMDNDSVRTESKLLLGKLSGAVKVRAPQVQKVADYIEKTRKERGISAIVCGDFNDTPISYSHKKLSENLTDCYVASGNGPGFSYHRAGMFVRIDNIFCSEEWQPYAAEVDDKITLSDHYPIICWLKRLSNPK